MHTYEIQVTLRVRATCSEDDARRIIEMTQCGTEINHGDNYGPVQRIRIDAVDAGYSPCQVNPRTAWGSHIIDWPRAEGAKA